MEDIKNKFKNLRTTFQRQYKMVKASKACNSDDVFVPQWKHYQQLMFLQGCWDQDDGTDEPPLSPLMVPQEESQPVLTSPGLIISFLPTTSTPSTSVPTSSCVSSNVVIKCFWTEERERALISFYSGIRSNLMIAWILKCFVSDGCSCFVLSRTEHSCLWNKKSENHNNRQLRQRLLESLRSQLSDHSVSFSGRD